MCHYVGLSIDIRPGRLLSCSTFDGVKTPFISSSGSGIQQNLHRNGHALIATRSNENKWSHAQQFFITVDTRQHIVCCWKGTQMLRYTPGQLLHIGLSYSRPMDQACIWFKLKDVRYGAYHNTSDRTTLQLKCNQSSARDCMQL